jgi:hypothetical protein
VTTSVARTDIDPYSDEAILSPYEDYRALAERISGSRWVT